MKKLLCILTAICILAMTMGSIVMAEETTTATNLACDTGVEVTVSSTAYNSTPKSNLVDGDTSTAWQSKKDTTAPYAQLKLVKPAKISEIKVTTTTSGKKANWIISYSMDGMAWTQASHTMTSTTSPYVATVSNADFVAQYVKIGYAQENAAIRVVEIEVYGEYASLAYLSSITPEFGSLSPAFNMGKTSYAVQVDDLENLPTLSYEKYTADAQVAYTEATAENNYTATIVVTHGEETETYTVQFVERNWALGAPVEEFNGRTDYGSIDNVTDGSLSDVGWFSPSPNSGAWAQVELPEVVAVDRIDFYSGNKENYNLFRVYYSLSKEEEGFVKADHYSCNSAEAPYKFTAELNGAMAKYVRVKVPDGAYVGIKEIEVYGRPVTEAYTTSYTLAENVLTGNVTFYNKTESTENDKYYLMAVYVDDVLYSVTPANSSSNSIAAGAAASTTLTSSTLPASGTVTAKLFVWDTPTTLVPVIAPLTLK